MGAFLGTWCCATAFVAVGVPFLALSSVLGGTPWAVPRVILVIALLLAGVCGLGLGLASPRSDEFASAWRTCLAVIAVVVATPALFGATKPLVTTTEPVRVLAVRPDSPRNTDNRWCGYEWGVREGVHTERTWWLLAVNPVTIIADGAGTREVDAGDRLSWSGPIDPLDSLRRQVRILRAGTPAQFDECSGFGTGTDDSVSHTAYWGGGLSTWLLLGNLGLAGAVRRQGRRDRLRRAAVAASGRGDGRHS